MAQKTKVSELAVQLAALGFVPDEIGIEKTFVEGYKCPACGRNLAYRGYEKSGETIAYGVCRNCDYARKFYFNSPVIAAGKRRYSKARG